MVFFRGCAQNFRTPWIIFQIFKKPWVCLNHALTKLLEECKYGFENAKVPAMNLLRDFSLADISNIRFFVWWLINGIKTVIMCNFVQNRLSDLDCYWPPYPFYSLYFSFGCKYLSWTSNVPSQVWKLHQILMNFLLIQ